MGKFISFFQNEKIRFTEKKQAEVFALGRASSQTILFYDLSSERALHSISSVALFVHWDTLYSFSKESYAYQIKHYIYDKPNGWTQAICFPDKTSQLKTDFLRFLNLIIIELLKYIFSLFNYFETIMKIKRQFRRKAFQYKTHFQVIFSFFLINENGSTTTTITGLGSTLD